MFFSQYTWDLYKQSKVGKKAIEYFEYSNVFWNDVEIIKKINPNQGKWIDRKHYESLMQDIGDSQTQNDGEPICFEFDNFSDVRNLYEKFLYEGIYYEFDNVKTYIVEPKDYPLFLQINTMMSFFFYAIANDYTVPNLFTYRFFDLNKIADTFNIELPPIPKKSDYRARCMYYIDLCEVFYKFRIENKLSPSELCAFLYDFALNFTDRNLENIPPPSQVWFIGGKTSVEEKDLDVLFWQANPETKRGDILIHYETSPVSAITHLYIAQTDGVIDPFFHFYSNTYIGNKIELPYVALKELKDDDYFSKNSLVRKSFQGVNGWAVSSEDYLQLLRILRDKGFNTDCLPIPYVPSISIGSNIKNEEEVENILLEPCLNQMGLVKGVDYVKQLSIRAGRGSRVYPDYALHYNDKKGYERARIIIEAKFYMKNNKEMEEAFLQARSYANILESSTIILCDKIGLIIYERKGSFDRGNYKKIYWEELKNFDKYQELNKILTK
ncbi:type I restriction endonuclease subunit R [Riemerella anatipestifer]|uniref:type I restriction endonuclease subunit R n=1 Tax=Riemerella anatipestifer TaxID=34085 RepID=UPI00129E77E6|nr:type I restriction endonuclease subunit R [Riemerella anatipestifer]MRM94375.1 type I restriction endonuclease subunit R [Riemerella anatipestifer]